MSELDRQLAALATMSPTALRKEWCRVLKSPAPRITPDLLRRGIAYRLQERVHGALTTGAARELDQLAKRLARGDTPLPASAIRMKPGSRLLRTWRNRTYVVLVGDSGYIYDNRLFASLSVIAREITGTPWSGPRFFGLLSKRAVNEHGNG